MAILFAPVATLKQGAVKERRSMFKRIGVYAGTFDPVHTGHIVFALQSMKEMNLDQVYFLPERRPRNKQHVEHFAHRVAMLKQATRPHPQFKVLELVDVSFTVERTLSRLNTLFAGDQLVFLFGSDVVMIMPGWSNIDRLLKSSELVIGLRRRYNQANISDSIKLWDVQPKQLKFINSYAPDVSSGKVREALRTRHRVAGILRSVEKYSDRHWLYISLAIDNT
jgi:nicotinate (nicotinamide) nucleotide adenylyltransferase